jgi:hypothetical protein
LWEEGPPLRAAKRRIELELKIKFARTNFISSSHLVGTKFVASSQSTCLVWKASTRHVI